jgi:hypothetical protein
MRAKLEVPNCLEKLFLELVDVIEPEIETDSDDLINVDEMLDCYPPHEVAHLRAVLEIYFENSDTVPESIPEELVVSINEGELDDYDAIKELIKFYIVKQSE